MSHSSESNADPACRDIPEPVVVTGASGFIGSRLVRRLRAAGLTVRALVLPEEDARLPAGVEILRGDIGEAADVSRLLADAGSVFHLAAVVGDWAPEALFQRVTVDGTRHVFAAASGMRVVLASSIVVYADRLGWETCVETLPHGQPLGPYSRAKQAQERLANHAVAAHQDIRIVRPANVCGAGSRPWVDELLKVLESRTPVLIDGGDFDAGLVHVDNVVEVMLRAMGPRARAGDIFNAADEEGITWRRYCTDLAGLAGAPAPRSMPGWLARVAAPVMEDLARLTRRRRRPPLTREALNLVASRFRLPMDRAREQLGYVPVTTYAQGLGEIETYLASRS